MRKLHTGRVVLCVLRVPKCHPCMLKVHTRISFSDLQQLSLALVNNKITITKKGLGYCKWPPWPRPLQLPWYVGLCGHISSIYQTHSPGEWATKEQWQWSQWPCDHNATASTSGYPDLDPHALTVRNTHASRGQLLVIYWVVWEGVWFYQPCHNHTVQFADAQRQGDPGWAWQQHCEQYLSVNPPRLESASHWTSHNQAQVAIRLDVRPTSKYIPIWWDKLLNKQQFLPKIWFTLSQK